jgi:hypothetical protein
LKKLIKDFITSNFIFKGKEKLSKLSILAIIFLDIFLLGTIYQGIDFQTKVINSPTVKYPYECRDVLAYDAVIEDFNNYSYGSGYNYDLRYQEIRNLEVDERCNVISEKISLIRKEINIDDLKKRSEELNSKEYYLSDQISYLKANYNTILFEKMSNQNSDKSIIKIENIQVTSPMQKSDKPIIKGNITSENIKQKYDLLNKEIEKLSKEKENLKLEFKNNSLVQDLVSYLEINKEKILKDISKSEKYYYVKEELIVLGFLIPLIILFFYFMKKYLLKEKYILYVIFKNILLVTLIPTIISLFNLINLFIPKIFIEKLLNIFYNLEIPFIVYYIVIALFILVFIFIIIKLQKKYKEENEKLINNSISFIEAYNKNICSRCKNRVDYEKMNYCPCCQNQLKIKCKICDKEIIKNMEFCFSCGNKID